MPFTVGKVPFEASQALCELLDPAKKFINLGKPFNPSTFKNFTRKNPQPEADMKPRGLWYALGNQWIEWCSSEEPSWVQEFVYEIEVDTKDMARLSTDQQMFDFTDRYTKKDTISGGANSDGTPYEGFSFSRGLRWKEIAETYSGIEVKGNHHQIGLNLGRKRRSQGDYLWLYGWDVDSGCIWRPEVVTRVTLAYQYSPETRTFEVA